MAKVKLTPAQQALLNKFAAHDPDGIAYSDTQLGFNAGLAILALWKKGMLVEVPFPLRNMGFLHGTQPDHYVRTARTDVRQQILPEWTEESDDRDASVRLFRLSAAGKEMAAQIALLGADLRAK